uniref:Protein phosphatase 1 regulatory subunit 1A n=1 Tax=Sus scrofa TaxID=9823 RepID=A0A8D1G5Y0_PIG
MRELQGLQPHGSLHFQASRGKEKTTCPKSPWTAFNKNQLYWQHDHRTEIRRRRPTPATLVLTSDQSSPEVDEDRIPNPLLKPTLSMSPRQRKKVTRTTPTMKELQMMVEHHLGQQQPGEEPEGAAESTGTQESCPPGITTTGAESRPGATGKADKPAESIPQERGSEKPSTEEPSTQ